MKAWCEVRTGRTPGLSDEVEERRRPYRARWGHDLSMGRTLEKPGPALYSPECVEGGFSEVRGQRVLGTSASTVRELVHSRDTLPAEKGVCSGRNLQGEVVRHFYPSRKE